MTAAMELRGITRRFGGLIAVDNVDLDVPVGEITGLVGPNGAGKSTTFACVGGQLRPTSGSVHWDGTDITGHPPERIARAGVARTFQTSRPIPGFSVLENVLVGASRLGKSSFLQDVFGGRRRNAEERDLREQSMESLALVGLSEQANDAGTELPYGQRRLLEIARALVAKPTLLMLDEPAAGLNSAETERLGALLGKLADSGIGVLLVEHNLGLVLGVCNRVAVLDFGKLIANGTPDEISKDPEVIAAYLGGDSSGSADAEG